MKASELQVGVITGTHGIKGLVKVLPFTDDPERFANMHEVTAVCVNGQRIPLEITHAGPHKDRILVSFKGMDNINLVEHLKGAELYVERKDAAPLGEDEYYFADLIGMKVIRDDGDNEQMIGILSDIMRTGANDVYVVRSESGHEILIPAIRDCIVDVDIDAGVMKVRLLPGMEE